MSVPRTRDRAAAHRGAPIEPAHHPPEPSSPRSARFPVLDSVPRRAVQLYPGQLYASKDPSIVTTILGSCVAVCLWDVRLRIGGMNHYMLPDPVGAGQVSPRFGAVACVQIVERLVALGSERRSLQAKIFGGACVISSLEGSGAHLGVKNVAVARAVLEREGIAVAAEETGGSTGRKLVFLTDTGTAWVQGILRAPHGP